MSDSFRILRVMGRYSGGLKTNVDVLDRFLLKCGPIDDIHLISFFDNAGDKAVDDLGRTHHVIDICSQNRWIRNLGPGAIYNAARCISHIVSDADINLMHIHSPHLPIGVISAIIGYSSSIPVITAYHGSSRENALEDAFMKVMAAIPNRISRRRLSVSNASKYLMGEDSYVMGVPVDTDMFFKQDDSSFFGRKDDSVIAFYPARITPMKGQMDILRAVKRLKDEGFGIPYRIAIAGPADPLSYREALSAFSCQSGIDNIVTIHEEIPFRDMPRAFNSADLQLFPTYCEGIGKIIVEAGLCGVPTIGYAVGGVPEVIRHDRNGLLVGKADIAGLASSLASLVCDSKRRITLGARAMQDYGTRFCAGDVAEAHLGIYNEVMQN